MSLRARLVWTTTVLLAVGLLASALATFLLVRSSLISRVDQQLDASRSLASQLVHDGEGGPGPERSRPDGYRGGRGGPGLPGTYVMLLDSAGRLEQGRSAGLRNIDSPPVLPDGLPGSKGISGDSRYFTARDASGSTDFRVLAFAEPDGTGTVVVAQPLDDVNAAISRLLTVEGLVGLVVLALAAGAALWLVRLNLQPLARIERAAADIAAGDLSRRVDTAPGTTEVGRLGAALNAMLERIEIAFAERRASEERLRRFVADASHELRTPLTSIRGYAELFRSGAGSRPDDLAKSMRRIEEESARMGKLVDELLLLARLDQDPELDLERVDLAALAADVAEDARVANPGSTIEVTAEEPAVVVGDEARLRQVVTNLLANAVKHSPDGSTISVRVVAGDGEARVEVADLGPGLEPEHAKKVFDRFFRVDKSRSRGEGGAGLGLAIVDAIVKAHGGRVWVDSSPGAGATFKAAFKLAVAEAGPPPKS